MKTVGMSEDDFHKNTMVQDTTVEETHNPDDASLPQPLPSSATAVEGNEEAYVSASAVPEDSSQTTAELRVSDHTAVTAPTDTDATGSQDHSERFHAAEEGDPAASGNPNEVASTFPQRLMEILDDPRNAELIAWLPHGRAFVIYRKREFAADVLPKYFQKFAKYSSFTRKLNRWGFVRVTRGPETGAYYHPLFRQNEGRLVLQMTCHSSISQNNNNAASSSKRANADSVGGSTAEASEPPSAAMMMYPNNVNSSYGYASYNYLHPNAFAPMDHPSQQNYGPYGYDPPGGMLPPNAAGGPHAPYNHASSGMYPPHHQYPLMGAPAPYPMFPSSHNMMEGYGSYDEKQQQYNNSMLMAQRNVDPQQVQPYPNYHGGDDAQFMPPMDERGYHHGNKMKGVPSSFRPARKGQPQASYYPSYAAGGVEGGPYGNMEDEEAERMRAASLSVDDSESPRPNREEENTLYSPAVRRPPAAYYGAHEGRGNEY